MRLFTGIALPSEISVPLGETINRLRPFAPLRWSKPENLHITTKFIGDWQTDRLSELIATLREIPKPPSFEIETGGFGWFPNPHQPRIFWVGVNGGEALRALAASTDQALVPEGKPYRPHLTLARSDPQAKVNLAELRQAVAAESTVMRRFRCVSFELYLSEPQAGGSRYSILESFPLENV